MKKVYPIIEGKYSFLGGWYDVPSTLHELVVGGRGYDITPSGEHDYIVRGASKLIMVDEKQFKKYFKPFVDYFAEPMVEYEESDTVDDVSKTITHEVEIKSLRIASSNARENVIEQLSLF